MSTYPPTARTSLRENTLGDRSGPGCCNRWSRRGRRRSCRATRAWQENQSKQRLLWDNPSRIFINRTAHRKQPSPTNPFIAFGDPIDYFANRFDWGTFATDEPNENCNISGTCASCSWGCYQRVQRVEWASHSLRNNKFNVVLLLPRECLLKVH